MFVYRGEALPVLCTESVTNHAINCAVNIHITFYTAFSLFSFLFILFIIFLSNVDYIYHSVSSSSYILYGFTSTSLSLSTMHLLPTSFVDDFSFLQIKRDFLDPPGNFLHALSFIVLNNHLVPFL